MVARVIILKGDKVSLGILSREDAPELFRMINNPKVSIFLRFPRRIIGLVDEYEWIDNNSNVVGKSHHFGIIENKSDKIVGVTGVEDIEAMTNAHVGYFIDEEQWGNGFASEALKLIIYYSFNILNIRKLYTHVYEPNKASRRVLEKNGFQNTGVQKEHHFIEGRGYTDALYYELLNPARQK